MLQLIAQTRFFSSGHPLSGLDPTALGAIYRGRAEFRISPEARKAGASREAARRQTIAERKAAESAAVGGKPTAAVDPVEPVEAPPVDDVVETTGTSRTTRPAASTPRSQPKRSSKSGRTGGKKS